MYFIFLFLLPAASAEAGLQDPTCWYFIYPVTIDGAWTTTTEWSDAERASMLGYGPFGYYYNYTDGYYYYGWVKEDFEYYGYYYYFGGYYYRNVYPYQAYFRMKHDPLYLYILIDFISDTRIEDGDYAKIYIDTSNNKLDPPQADDYALEFHWHGVGWHEYFERRGTGVAWTEEKGTYVGGTAFSSTDAANNPDFPIPHVMYEFRIPKNIFGTHLTVGLFICAHDNSSGSSDIFWPNIGAYEDKPSTWGEFTFSSTPIPELSKIALALPAVILLTLITLYAYSREKRLKKGRDFRDRSA
jgi:hypothetical protein